MSKVIQDAYIAIGSFIVFCGIAFFSYYYTTKLPILSSTIGLILANAFTIGGIVVMYIGDRSGRPSKIVTSMAAMGEYNRNTISPRMVTFCKF